MITRKGFTYPTEPVTVDFGDGKMRELRYDFGALRRLKKIFGASLITGEALNGIDEDRLPELLFEGLVNREGIADADALAAKMRPAAAMYLIQQFHAAFTGTFPAADPNAASSQPAT